MPVWILGAATLGAGALGAGASLFGANAQANAANNAASTQRQLFEQGVVGQQTYVNDATNLLDPLINSGIGPLSWYNYLTGGGPAPQGSIPWTSTGTNGQQTTIGGAGSVFNPLTAPLTAPFTAAMLPSTPGYQFTLSQGLKSTQNGYAAEGLGSSGAALKGAADYSTGLAQNTYQQQFQNYWAQNQNIANMLLGGATPGINATGNLAGIYSGAGGALLGTATNAGQGIAGSIMGGGNALAGGAAGVANSLGGAANNLAMYYMLSKLPGFSGAATNAAPNYTTNALATSGAFGPSPLGYPSVPYTDSANYFGAGGGF